MIHTFFFEFEETCSFIFGLNFLANFINSRIALNKRIITNPTLLPVYNSILENRIAYYFSVFSMRAIRIISLAISSGERIKSMHPLSIAVSGISGCVAVSGF
jgi:hypothetical protein